MSASETIRTSIANVRSNDRERSRRKQSSPVEYLPLGIDPTSDPRSKVGFSKALVMFLKRPAWWRFSGENRSRRVVKPSTFEFASQNSQRVYAGLCLTFHDDVVRPWPDSTDFVAKNETTTIVARRPFARSSGIADRHGRSQRSNRTQTMSLNRLASDMFLDGLHDRQPISAARNVAESEVDRERPQVCSWLFTGS